MSTEEFRGIYFDDPRHQAKLEDLIAAVGAAEQEREPVGQRHKQAERDLEDGSLDEETFRTIDDQYIAANNKIAAAKRDVDAYLQQHPDYKST